MFLEDIIAGISKYKDVQNILGCLPHLLQDPGALGYKYISQNFGCFVVLLLSDFMMFSSK